MRTTLRAVAVIALLASACGAPDAPDQGSAADDLRWRWCRSKSICRVPHTWWRYCTDTSSDARNCGACGVRCGEGEACVSGSCTPTCGDGLVGCATGCTDIASDPANCGGCGVACGTDQLCQGGQCADVCPGGQRNCGAPDAVACTDVLSDEANCGQCGNACQLGEVCTSGACTAVCDPPIDNPTYCTGSDGVLYCTDILNDQGNCGACGNVCLGGTACDGTGHCVCPVGFQDCNGQCVGVQDDRYNCGGCGVQCAYNEVCSGGLCEIPCGFTSCQDGCFDTSSDPNHCGSCSNVCGSGLCTGGNCACEAPLSYCGGACVDTAIDASNCGGCGVTCAAGEQCVGGGCQTPPPANRFDPSVTFDEQTSVPVTTMAFDGTNLWTGGSFVRTTGALNWAFYGRNGSPATTCPNAVTLDTRGIFSPGAGALPYPVYMRYTNSGYIYQMNGCSLQSQPVALLATPPGFAWTAAVSVVMTPDRSQYVAMSNGLVHRWTACSTTSPTCAYLGSTTLQGWDTGAFAGESASPQNGRIAIAGDKVLTYFNGKLSVWDAAGNRLRAVDLVGAGVTADSHYSLSFADGLVWIIDAQGGTWRGYAVGL